VETKPGRGSTFTVLVPAAAAWAASRPALKSAPPLKLVDHSTAQVIIVEDDAEVGELVQRVLRKKNISAVVVDRGAVALQLVQASRPQAIILDVMLPDMSGWTVLSRLKNDARLSTIPVFLVTVMDGRAKALELGATDFLQKPVDTNRLVNAIQGVIARDSGHILIVEDDQDARELYSSVLTSKGWQTKIAGDGVDGLRSVDEDPPSCILLDLMMPRMDGFEFLEQIRGRAHAKNIPVVVLTAKELDAEDGERLQSAKVLTKGQTSVDDLLRLVTAVTAGQESQEVLPVPESGPRP
jgi:DNA-binding response OmpR family regulator